LRDRLPGGAWLSEKLLGLAAERPLPRWSSRPFLPDEAALGPEGGREVVLLADSFNRWFEPENLRAACDVLVAGGCRVHLATPADGGRPLCCGRTYLAAGLVDEARAEQSRVMASLRPFLERDVPVVGLEPSCLLTFRDETPALQPGPESDQLSRKALLFEEYLALGLDEGWLDLQLKPLPQRQALLHGHCHQKAFAALKPVERILGLIPELDVQTIETSCCGMAGAFGYQAETLDVSRAMGEAALLPAVHAAGSDTLIVADGTSCRHQIADGAQRQAEHVARVLQRAL